jgi:hypothetical protein
MEFHKKRIIYEDKNVTNDPNMGSVCYFRGTMNEYPPPLCKCYSCGTMNEQPPPLCERSSSQWQVMRLKGGIDEDFHTLS